jgi:putative membrane protein
VQEATSPAVALRAIDRVSDRAFYVFTAVLSTAALAFIAYILLVHRGAAPGRADLAFMPGVNAALNASAATLLVAGYWAIRTKRVRTHRFIMVSAFVASSLFLVGYLVYHSLHGDTRFGTHGAIRAVYLLMLASHVLLSMAVPPLALIAFYLAFKRRFRTHRRVARVLLPIWLYVSVTGVLVYWMLYHLDAASRTIG